MVDAAHAAFIQAGVSISVGGCDRNNRPSLVRATGCRVSPDGRRLVIFVSVVQAAPLLQCIRDNGSIAVVFTQPSTHRTVQFKGIDAVLGVLQDGDLQCIRNYRDAFCSELEPMGFTRIQIRTLLAVPPADLVTLEFTPCEAYSQTPGPSAGEALKAST